MKLRSLWCMVLGTFLLVGCGEDPEKAAFRQQLIDKALNDETRKAGEAYLAANATQEGITTLSSGLQYKILVEGQGESPTMRDSVEVHYEGTRVDGYVFDSSYQREKPSIFPLKGLIKGWQEALIKIPVGSTWMLFLPPELAYGATSPSNDIPANSTLIFKVELLDILSKGEKNG